VALGLMSAPEIADAQHGAVIACWSISCCLFTVLTLFPVLSRLNYDLIEAAEPWAHADSAPLRRWWCHLTQRPA